ncbi:ankyrin repeat-containing domain protein [Chytriomyces sp. MP71]|nr:ankyrin repeat-containing domain protein [Chytriomyces sp. MP71]
MPHGRTIHELPRERCALASKNLFGLSVTADFVLAQSHLARVVEAADKDAWRLLPLAYKAALYRFMFLFRKIWNLEHCIVSNAQALSIIMMLNDFQTSGSTSQLARVRSKSSSSSLESRYGQSHAVYSIHCNEDIMLRWACGTGHFDAAKLLLSLGADPSAKSNDSIQWACANNHMEVVKLLIADPRVDPSADHDYALRLTTTLGNFEICELLLADARVNAAVDRNNPLRSAATFGQVGIIQLLLANPAVDPTDLDSKALSDAAEAGKTNCVKLMLRDGRANPAARQNFALRAASKNGHSSTVSALLEDPRVDPTDVDHDAIKAAYTNNHLNTLKLLLADARIIDDEIKKKYSPSWAQWISSLV